jgi:nitroreductase
MSYAHPITDLIHRRYSCRTYADRLIEAPIRQQLEAFLTRVGPNPFGTRARFALVAATPEDPQALRGLGTYGFVKRPSAFVVAAVERTLHDMEDVGYLLERVVLYATDLGLGTCWLGGTFTQSRFADRIALRAGESLPAVIAVGHIAGQPRWVDKLIRLGAGSDKRKPWELLFFESTFAAPLSRQAAGLYAIALDMVRAAPSASNRQPWRIVKDDARWHFYLQPSSAYGNSPLQRVDMGIAMCHWALTARELGLQGEWTVDPPALATQDSDAAYIATWLAR